MQPELDFSQAFEALTGNTPFPWQRSLFEEFVAGRIPRTCDIPTGLGKTAVMAIWLIAKAYGAVLPRRLVYVVDRRAVVDQATEVAKELREGVERSPELKSKLGLERRLLPISTLRGQYVDNREWLEDPATPAVIVGTVDMVGSRLLFEGYGTSRKMRPFHAGLLGTDAMVVLDEAHLVPPFEKLIETLADSSDVFGPRDEALREIVPPFKLLSLSATGRRSSGTPLTLQDADLKHSIVSRRLSAPKRLVVLPPFDSNRTQLRDVLAERAWKLAGDGTRAVRCIVFCDKRKDAEDVKAAIDDRAGGDRKRRIPEVRVDTELFVGGRRVFEREKAARWLKERGFIAGTKVERTQPVFVVATSAGEVGVDLDADHMVSDLVSWERMVQRLGRVNRRGDGEADVIIAVEPDPKPSKAVTAALTKDPGDRNDHERNAIRKYEASIKRARAVLQLLDRLPRKNGAADASTGALRAIKLSAAADPELQTLLDDATTPAPLRPALSRALIDAWSMTSLKEHSGRPEIDPWMRGWVEDDPPQTAVVWRTHLPVRTRGRDATQNEIEAFFEAAPPHASELLETETYRVVEWITARARGLVTTSDSQASPASRDGEISSLHHRDVVAVALTSAGDLRTVLRLEDLALADDKKAEEKLQRTLASATLVVDARIGGLRVGLLDNATMLPPRSLDDGASWISADAGDNGERASISAAPVVRFRVRTAEAGQPPSVDPQWRERLRFAIELSEDGEPGRCLIVEEWRHGGATEDDRSAGRPQWLDDHQKWVEERVRRLACRLGLPDAYVDMLATAARVHDEGKRSRRWQRAFNASDDGVYAKTSGPVNVALLDGYRHEFGSLPNAEKDERLRLLSDDLRDLALHLIAAHHGFARPVIGINSCEDAPPSVLEERARVVALRFARLQKRWGPWGLAWWEALLRAADQQASRDNDVAEPAVGEEVI